MHPTKGFRLFGGCPEPTLNIPERRLGACYRDGCARLSSCQSHGRSVTSSIANPVGTDRAVLPALLRRMADALEEFGPVEVQDLTLGTEITEDGTVHHLTVYFHPEDSDGS
jgi:hypothetical protein